MANIQFFLNRGKTIPDKSKPQSIYLRYRIGRKVDFFASLKSKVLPDDWDNKKQRVKDRNHIQDGDAINEQIDRISNHFKKFDNENKAKGVIPSYHLVKKHYDSCHTVVEQDQEPQKPTLFTYIDDLIQRPETKRELTKGSIKNYRLTRTFLKRFNDEVYSIDFDTISLEWYNDFIDWCNGQQLSTNYIGKHIKTLKTFMTKAIDDEVTDNLKFKHKKFKVLREESDNVYLNESELEKIWNLDLESLPRHKNARDLFLVGAYSGLRVSDYNKLTGDNFKTVNGVKILKVKAQKTKKDVAIPLKPIVEIILENYEGHPPPSMPDQTINKYIKEVAEFAGIDQTINITQTKGGKEITLRKCKFELIKTHTARRSFCTNAYLSGMPTLDIMSISGHTSEKNFLTYIKVTAEERAIKISQHPFFKGNTLKAV